MTKKTILPKMQVTLKYQSKFQYLICHSSQFYAYSRVWVTFMCFSVHLHLIYFDIWAWPLWIDAKRTKINHSPLLLLLSLLPTEPFLQVHFIGISAFPFPFMWWCPLTPFVIAVEYPFPLLTPLLTPLLVGPLPFRWSSCMALAFGMIAAAVVPLFLLPKSLQAAHLTPSLSRYVLLRQIPRAGSASTLGHLLLTIENLEPHFLRVKNFPPRPPPNFARNLPLVEPHALPKLKLHTLS